LLALDAEARIASSGGERTVPLAEFFRGPSRTVLGAGELLVHFFIPEPRPNTGMAYWKQMRRKAMDLPILGVAVLLSFESDLKTCATARIALGVAAPTPIRARAAEAFLEGKPIDGKVLDEAGRIASEQANPRTTIRGAEWYRRHMIRVLVGRVGMICQERAKGAARQ
jgi:carbon-monoxide dehydrogenase medium subunit